MRIPHLLTALLVIPALAVAALAGDLEDAQVFQKAGDYEKALPLFEKAVAADPGSQAAALGLAQVLTGLGRYEEAVKAASTGLKANEGDVSLLVEKARTNLLWADRAAAAGEDGGKILGLYVAEADAALRRALADDPKNADGRVLRAKVMQHQGGGPTNEALTLLEAVAKEFPDHFDANWELGQRWFNVARGKSDNSLWARAETHFRACTEIDPKSGLAFERCADAMAWQRKGQTAIAHLYEKAAFLQPDSRAAVKKFYQWSGGDKAYRVEVFQRLAKERPADGWVGLFHGYAVKDNGDLRGGIKVLADAEKTAPGDPLLPLNRGHLLLEAGESDQAVRAYRKAIEACGPARNDAVYNDIDGRAYKSSADALTPSQRDKLWTALWKKWPDEWQGPNDAGLWYRDTAKDYRMSAEWYLRAADVAPDSAQVQNDTGLILDQYLKKYDDAEPYYRRAIAIGEERGLDWRGGSFEDTGYRDAINNFGRMLAGQKRAKSLAKFVEEHVPAEHPQRDVWMRASKGR